MASIGRERDQGAGAGLPREASIDLCVANDRLGARGGLSAPVIPGSGKQAAAGTRALAAQDSIKAADGAMGMHLRKLEDSGYIACRKAFVGRRPKSTYRITGAGRRALAKYLDAMQQVIDAIDLSQYHS